MRVTDLDEYVEHFRARVLQDALSEATAAYWRHRAETFRRALPRPGDFMGRATEGDIEAQQERISATILACRQRAVFMLGGEVE